MIVPIAGDRYGFGAMRQFGRSRPALSKWAESAVRVVNVIYCVCRSVNGDEAGDMAGGIIRFIQIHGGKNGRQENIYLFVPALARRLVAVGWSADDGETRK